MIGLIRLGSPTSAPPLFAIPGLDGSIGSVEPIVKQLARQREVLVVDFSGETQPTLEALAAEIADTIRAEGRSAIDVLGQSIGTILAAQVASRHNLPVRKVVLTCTFTILRWNVLRWVVSLSKITPTWLYRLTSWPSVAISCGPVGDGGRHPCFAGAREADKRVVAKRTAWQIDRDFSADLVRVQAPLLILMGDSDRFVPNAPREIAKLRTMFAQRPTARVDVIPGAGHIFLPSAAIALAVQKIEDFLR
jgi:pimeloyl-ACP methyl ester carboxylesterase